MDKGSAYVPHAHSHNKYELFQENSYYDTRYVTPQSENVDVAALEDDLKSAQVGEVRFDPGSKATYSTDSGNYRQIPLGVVVPRTQRDIEEIIAICHRHKAPVVNRGGGTSLAGQTCNVAVVIDMSKYYNRVLVLDKEGKTVTVQPGIVLDHMKAYTEQHGLTFGPDPSTHNHCTIGGMLGNNSCGVHSIMSANYGYGAKMEHNITTMTVLTYDGIKMTVGPTSDEEFARIVAGGGRKAEIYMKLRALVDKYADQIRERFPDIPRRVSGYNLPDLLPERGFNVAAALVGSESTCVTILSATCRLMPTPKARSLVVLGYPDLYESGKHVKEILAFKPIGLEGLDDLLIQNMQRKGYHTEHLTLLPGGKAWLLVEFGGDSKTESDELAHAMMAKLKARKDPPEMNLFDDPKQEEMIWKIRESGLGATAWVPGDPITEEGWEDSAAPPDKVGEYLVALRKLFEKYGWANVPLYGHFGQGCVHCRIPFDLQSPEGLDQYKRFTEEAAHLVVSFGGSISGEHGDGQSKADLLGIMYGPELVQAFREFKEIWDPDWRMNPGKITEPYGQLRNLRTGAQYQPAEPVTHFQYPDDIGRFSRAALRCVGIGECRRTSGGTMCPSYRVTKEEEHSTRGRARLLYEMLMGDVVDGWKDKNVKNALDLCLSCKGCKGDCPVNVDMATYKAEFLSHYYKGKVRPRSAYAMGFIYWWARLASVTPRVANFFTQTPGLRSISKWIMGVAPQRQIPAFATQTFKDWFRRRTGPAYYRPLGDRMRPGERPRVILWADTFNNNYFPETLKAAVTVLEAAGFSVAVPGASLCCGRPLYDYGLLTTAKKLLRKILDTLREDIRNGIPVVGLEPSCIAVFRDELTNLFPTDKDAVRLKTQTFTLAEFLQKKAPNFRPPLLKHEALVHGHCHQKAIMKMDAEKELFEKMKLDFEIVDSGCCGMAGSFGYEKGTHYTVSVQVGELVLLPAVRNASRDAFIIADGFSCREQIIQQTDRTPMHTAEVIALALRQGQTSVVAQPSMVTQPASTSEPISNKKEISQHED
ncbi:MAG TPA: FAD-binding and (Fe-S)-binding domain-containing protein [Puia sp.]|jgi:FAD/FMN-containing dehydrogenase/Fe-S oxidoreductase|nr:FAD-binding and (Fe-S)-binding domain-containing protein [Puia sp.]